MLYPQARNEHVEFFQDQVKFLESRSLAANVIKEIGLDKDERFLDKRAFNIFRFLIKLPSKTIGFFTWLVTPSQSEIAGDEAAKAYAEERVVFGRPIAEYQLTQAKLGRMAATIQAARQFAYVVARLMAKGEGTLEAAMVKAYVCKAAEWVTREAMQIHGGYGYAEEYTVSRLFVDARVLSIFEGTDEILCLRVISRRLLDQWDR